MGHETDIKRNLKMNVVCEKNRRNIEIHINSINYPVSGIPNFVTIGLSVRELSSENPRGGGVHQPPVPAMVNLET